MGNDETVTVAQMQARGLYDPDAADAAERLRLLEYLVSLGASLDDIAAAGDEAPAVASTVILRGPGERFSRAEAARRAGVPVETVIRLSGAAGLPDPGPDAPVYGDEDVELLRVLASGIELLGVDAAFQLVRVIGSALARIADAEVAAFLTNVGGPLMASDSSGLELARANAFAATLLRNAGGAIDVLLRRHVEVAQRPLLPGAQDTIHLAVGFADLVGSTALAQDLTIAELGQAVAEFEEQVIDTIGELRGRTVKFIGDEVMFIAGEPAVAVEIGLRLVEKLSDHPRLPPLRVGVAFGDVLTRDGDYFGATVNVAARIVQHAAPGEVLASAAMRDALSSTPQYSLTSRGAPELRGIRERTELFELRRSTRA